MQLGNFTAKTVSQVSTLSGRMLTAAFLMTALFSTVIHVPTAQAADVPPIVTWGDSIGNGMGQILKTNYCGKVDNRGVNGSGLSAGNTASLNNLPAGAIVLMSIGTNDVGYYPNATTYANNVIAKANSIKAQGGRPIIIGFQEPTNAQGNPTYYSEWKPAWQTPAFLNGWITQSNSMNAAIKSKAQQSNYTHSAVKNRIPANQRAADHLHYTSAGSLTMAKNAFADAGITLYLKGNCPSTGTTTAGTPPASPPPTNTPSTNTGTTTTSTSSAGTGSTSSSADFGDSYSTTSPRPGPDNKCNPSEANLTGNFAENPCNWTKDNQSIDYAQQYRAGSRFVKHVSDWWKNQMLPNMKLMTKQINASIVDQTRQLGSMMDTQNVADVGRALQEVELKNKKDMIPNEKTCTAATPLLALGTTTKAAAGISKMFVFAQGARSSGIRLPGEVKRLERIAAAEALENQSSVTGNAQAAAPVSKILSPAQDVKERLENYCKYFKDIDVNGGNGAIPNVCANTNAADMARHMPDADIDIEGRLLRDTIDMSKPEEQSWAKAILANLTEPKILERLPDGGDNVSGVLKSDQGRESVMQRQYLSAIRKISYEVISSMIARRTAIPGTDKTFNITVTKPGTGENTTSTPDEVLDADGGEGVVGSSGSCQTTRPYALGGTFASLIYGSKEPIAVPPDRAPCGDFNAFLHALGKREGGPKGYQAENSIGYLGKYQFGAEALQRYGYCRASCAKTKKGKCVAYYGRCSNWTGKDNIKSGQDFKNRPDIQEKLIRLFLDGMQAEQVRLGLTAYLGKTLPNGVVVTQSGIIAAAHLTGNGGVKCLLTRNVSYCNKINVSYDSNIIPKDGNNLRNTAYINVLNGYTTRYSPAWPDPNGVITTSPAMGELAATTDGTTHVSVPGTTETISVTVNTQIADIRKKAGVHPQDISAQPSYNEIMTAMTKERFFNPEYYAAMSNDLGAILQEQTVVKSYISIQLEDINRLQEQINALLAARASLKLNAQPMPDLSNKAPVKPQ